MKVKHSRNAFVKAGRWGQQSLILRLAVASTVVTLAVMGALLAVMSWQTRSTAVDATERAMMSAMSSAEQTLRLVLTTATNRGAELLPTFIKMLGGEPKLDGSVAPTGSAGQAPRLHVGGVTVNGDSATLESFQNTYGADAAVLVRHDGKWIRAATLLKDESGNYRVGSELAADDVLSRALDKGEDFAGLIQRNNRWYAIVVRPLKDDVGTVYAGLTVRIDAHSDITRVISWAEATRVAEHGTLGIVRPSDDEKTWLYGSGPRAGTALDEKSMALIKTGLPQSQGFRETVMGENQEAMFVAWKQVEGWSWRLFSMGSKEAFLASSTQALRLQLLMMLAGMILISGTIWIVARRTLSPIQSIVRGMEELGQGNLASQIPSVPQRSRNEIHVLFKHLKHTQQQLAETVLSVRSGVDQIHVGSKEISAGNTDLSSRTEQQAASLEETAASMEELSGTVKQNADNARQASALAVDASRVAQVGGAAVGDVVKTMDDIAQSSSKIVEIVSVIDSIAFQTNILALNAAVEAARAGEQGKGFAVVATEVRALAQRSASAAKEIHELITRSVERVKLGTTQVSHAGSTMQQIVQSVRRVEDIMQEISAASNEQASGIEQVNRAVNQMDEVTQQNAALVEQAAAAAGSLEEQARQLAHAVQVFKTDPHRSLPAQA